MTAPRDDALDGRDGEHGEGEGDPEGGGFGDGAEEEEEDDGGEGLDGVHDAVDAEVDVAADAAADESDDGAGGDADEGGEEADVEGEAGALGDAGEEVVSSAVGAEPVTAGGAFEGGGGEGGVGAGGEEVVEVADDAFVDGDLGGIEFGEVRDEDAVVDEALDVFDHVVDDFALDGEVAVDVGVAEEGGEFGLGDVGGFAVECVGDFVVGEVGVGDFEDGLGVVASDAEPAAAVADGADGDDGPDDDEDETGSAEGFVAEEGAEGFEEEAPEAAFFDAEALCSGEFFEAFVGGCGCAVAHGGAPSCSGCVGRSGRR